MGLSLSGFCYDIKKKSSGKYFYEIEHFLPVGHSCPESGENRIRGFDHAPEAIVIIDNCGFQGHELAGLHHVEVVSGIHAARVAAETRAPARDVHGKIIFLQHPYHGNVMTPCHLRGMNFFVFF